MLEIKHQITKTLNIKLNSRGSDFVTPNFLLSCNALCSYCYTYRFGRKYIYVNDNVDEILDRVFKHSLTLGNKIPNQTDEKYWTYDICTDTDLNFHWKDYDWNKVLKFFTDTPNIKATFATKFVNQQLLKYGNEKLRIRYSLSPQKIADIVEKNTTKISTRIKSINQFIENEWDTHINFSPIIYTDTWLQDYKLLFEEINDVVKYKDKISCEIIFLTHNEFLHNINLEKRFVEAENLLWNPSIQEAKISQYGGNNVRYQWQFKNELINQFKQLHQEHLNWCKIRYIF